MGGGDNNGRRREGVRCGDKKKLGSEREREREWG
jgi:hypothetical protein